MAYNTYPNKVVNNESSSNNSERRMNIQKTQDIENYLAFGITKQVECRINNEDFQDDYFKNFQVKISSKKFSGSNLTEIEEKKMPNESKNIYRIVDEKENRQNHENEIELITSHLQNINFSNNSLKKVQDNSTKKSYIDTKLEEKAKTLITKEKDTSSSKQYILEDLSYDYQPQQSQHIIMNNYYFNSNSYYPNPYYFSSINEFNNNMQHSIHNINNTQQYMEYSSFNQMQNPLPQNFINYSYIPSQNYYPQQISNVFNPLNPENQINDNINNNQKLLNDENLLINKIEFFLRSNDIKSLFMNRCNYVSMKNMIQILGKKCDLLIYPKIKKCLIQLCVHQSANYIIQLLIPYLSKENIIEFYFSVSFFMLFFNFIQNFSD